MTFDLTAWPDWGTRALWTAGTIGVAWLVGHILNATVVDRMARLAAGTSRKWDEAFVGELKRRVPLWSLLVGAYASQAHWNQAPEHALLLTRALSRRHELALRTAVGASRWRLFRQLMAEALVVVLLGGLAGLLLAHWGTAWLIGVLLVVRGVRSDRHQRSPPSGSTSAGSTSMGSISACCWAVNERPSVSRFMMRS